MTLSFPLSLNDFADTLKIESVKWRLQRRDEISGLGSGQILGAALSPALWMADVTLTLMRHDAAATAQALVESLDGPIRSFYLYAPQKKYPTSDPDGSTLGAATPLIASLPTNAYTILLKSLPANYQLKAGDLFSFDYGSDPTRRALHRIVEDVTADGSGNTSAFEVRPAIRTGATVDTEITLVKPAAKVFIMPDSFDPGTAQRLHTEGMSFQVMQRIP